MASDSPGKVLLKQQTSRLSQLGDVLTPGIFLVGFTAFLVAMLFVEKPVSRGDWWGAGMLIGVCGLLALVMVIGMGVFFLAIFNPKVRLRADSDRMAAGEALALSWEIGPRSHVIEELRIDLEGQLEAPPPGGGRNQIKTVACYSVFRTRNRSEIKAGQASFLVPSDALPSSSEQDHRVRWAVRVTGKIPNWPDIRDEFEITVLPAHAK
jgi:hypothetical protein